MHRRLPYYPALDGIRAFAVLIVLFFHGGFEWAGGAFLGISTFFTLSGFLITGLLVTEYETDGTIDVVEFWRRRIRRLMPAALLTLLAMSLYAGFVAQPQELLQLRGDVLAALFYVANWRFWLTDQSYQRVLTDPSPVQHLWSLSIEEQFYLFFPLLTLATLRWAGGSRGAFSAILIALVAASTTSSIELFHDGDGFGRVYYGTDTRAAELLVGAVLGLAAAGRPALSPRSGALFLANALGLIGMAIVGWLWVTTPLENHWFFEGGALGYSLVSAAIIYAATQSGPVRALLGIAPLRWIGRISYGLYVYHWPIFLWLDAEVTGLDGWALFGARTAVTFLVSAVSYQLVELPIRKQRLRWQTRELAVVAAAFVFIVASTAAVTAALYRPGIGAQPVHLPAEQRNSKASSADQLRVLVIGDSVARGVGAGLVRHTRAQENPKLFVANRGRLRCSVSRAHGVQMDGGRVNRKSARCADNWPRFIRVTQPDVVLMMPSVFDLSPRKATKNSRIVSPPSPEFDAILMAGYEAAIDVLSAKGHQVVLTSLPCARPEENRGEVNLAAVLSDENVRHMNEVVLPELMARRPEVIGLLPLHDVVCPDGEFRSTLGTVENARPDGIHFEDAATDWLAPWLEAEILKLDRKMKLRARRG